MVDLLSGEWLNDEIVNSFSKLINELLAEVLGQKFIFPSSFMSKLLNVSPTGKTGRYKYSNVRIFSKRWVPGKDVFKLDTLMFFRSKDCGSVALGNIFVSKWSHTSEVNRAFLRK